MIRPKTQSELAGDFLDVAGLAAEEFNYHLPEQAVAQLPAEPRDSARLMCCINGDVTHRTIRDLPRLVKPGDVVVVNDTKVRMARLRLEKQTGGVVEVLLLSPTGRRGDKNEVARSESGHEWTALVKPSKRVQEGTVLYHEGQPICEVGSRSEGGSGERLVELYDSDVVENIGLVPLPPYITSTLPDPDRYQTVYANRLGSAAAPTAGLHLTRELIDQVIERGARFETVELEVGLGTFKPITTELIAEHQMHAETYRIASDTWDAVQSAKRVIAIGTTTVRTLESAATTGQLEGETRLYIHRGFNWQVVDVLLTNFHVPKSSLLVMIDAFVGPQWRDLYTEALQKGYRFLSFGDAMLLGRAHGKI